MLSLCFLALNSPHHAFRPLLTICISPRALYSSSLCSRFALSPRVLCPPSSRFPPLPTRISSLLAFCAPFPRVFHVSPRAFRSLLAFCTLWSCALSNRALCSPLALLVFSSRFQLSLLFVPSRRALHSLLVLRALSVAPEYHLFIFSCSYHTAPLVLTSSSLSM